MRSSAREAYIEVTRDEDPSQSEGQGKVATVDHEEMAFALSLFVAAARGQVALPNQRSSGFELRSDLRGTDPVLEGARKSLVDGENPNSDEIPLACAVAVIWHHYRESASQQAICSRLVAFYSLMIRSKGTAIGITVQLTEEDSCSVTLDPSVVQAIASAPLNGDGQFVERVFRDLIADAKPLEQLSESGVASSIRSRPERSIAVTDIVHELALLIFAFEAGRGESSTSGAPYLRVFEKLREPFAAVAGAWNLRPLLSRALASTRSSYPWLRSARVAESGVIEGMDEAPLDLHPQEVYEGELALISSLVELLRSLLGDAVTIQLLKTVWPLVTLDSHSL